VSLENMRFLPKPFFVLLLSLVISTAWCQKTTRIVVVDSATFKPLPAVLVQVKNTTRSLLADASGVFIIKTKPNDTLQLSHVGYKSKMIPLFFEEDAILVLMSEKITLLQEVTVASRKLYPNEINPRKSISPKTRTLIGSLASPWEYFNKREKEKRKVKRLMDENDRIRTFIEVIIDPTVKEELMTRYNLSEEQYYDTLVKFNQKKFQVIYSNDADAIITALQEFFDENSKH
jgi:hypothetical protein